MFHAILIDRNGRKAFTTEGFITAKEAVMNLFFHYHLDHGDKIEIEFR